MKNRKWFFILLALLFSRNTLWPQENNADAVVDDLLHEYTLNTDGSVVYRYSHALRLLTSFAFTRQYGESFIIYDPRFQKLDVLRSETVMADGKKVQSPPNAYNEVLPQFASDCPPYMHLREMVVTHTGLEKNAVIHLEYRLNTRKNFYPALTGKIALAGRDPIRQMTVRVNVPAGTQLLYETTSDMVKPAIVKKGKWTEYTWTLKEIPLIPVEPGQAPLEHFIPYLYFTTASPKNVVTHVLPDEKKAYTLPQSLKTQAQTLIKDKTELQQRVIALSDFVRKNVTTMKTDLYYLGYRAQTAEKTYLNQCGSTLDKAILLTAILRSVGIEAYPALISDVPEIRNEAMIPVFLSGAAVFVKVLNAWIDLSNPQNDAIPYPFFGRSALVLKINPELVKITPPLQESRLQIKAQIQCDDQGKLTGKGEAEADGLFRNEWNPPAMSGLIRSTTNTSSLKVNIQENAATFRSGLPAVYPLDLNGSLSAHESGSYSTLILPGTINLIQGLPLQSLTRQTPVFMPHPLTEIQEWDMEFTQSFSILTLPQNIRVSNAIGESAIEIRQQDQILKVKRTLRIIKNRIESSDYPMLYDLLRIHRDPANRIILIAQKP